MAMGPAKGQAATLQIEMVCLDELVPVDDRLRRLDGLVDWGFVRVEAARYYAAVVGRPSIDPIVLVKLMLVGALEGIDSMRELLRVASMRVDIRRFLGYGFMERLPVHQTISHAQTRRFVDAKLFERLFLRDGRQPFVSRRPPADRFPRWLLSRHRIVSIRGVSEGRALVLRERGGVDGGCGDRAAARGGQAPVGGRVTGGDRSRAGAHTAVGGQVDGAL